MTADLVHRAGAPFHVRWDYGGDLSDVAMTAVVSGSVGEIGRLRVLRTEKGGTVDLFASAADVAGWPAGELLLDVQLLRGDVSGRLDTVLIDLIPEQAT